MISSLIERPHRGTCHHSSRHNRGEATGTRIPPQIKDFPSFISIQSASNSLIALTKIFLGLLLRSFLRLSNPPTDPEIPALGSRNRPGGFRSRQPSGSLQRLAHWESMGPRRWPGGSASRRLTLVRSSSSIGRPIRNSGDGRTGPSFRRCCSADSGWTLLLRSDAKTVRWPNRYMDDRGREFWHRVLTL